MNNTWLSLLPPLIVLVVGFFSRRVIFSLLCGIFSAAFIASDFAAANSLKLAVKQLWANTELWRFQSLQSFAGGSKLFIMLFLIMLAIIVVLVGYSGGAYAYGRFAKKRIKDAKSAESATSLLSFGLFVDDYFSSLTVGSVMRPITDQFNVPRTKLAFLVDSMAAPLAIFCPVSSWIAGIIGFLSDNNVSLKKTADTLILADPFSIYLRTLPFVFYSILIISSVWFIIRRRISFGSMHEHERIAKKGDNLFGGKEAVTDVMRDVPRSNKEHAQLIDFLLPIGMLLATVIGGLLGSGGYVLFGGSRTLLAALQHANAAQALLFGGTISLGVTTVFYLVRKRISFQEIGFLYLDGIKLMLPTTIVLVCAWTLGDVLRDDLLTGQYLGSLLQSLSAPLVLLPALMFITSFVTSFAIGSSWATMGIFFPIAIPMVISLLGLSTPTTIDQLWLLFPVLGAVFSGAVAGDHMSPISDTTVMSATSSGCHLIDHVETQFGYALPSVVGSIVAFLIAGALMMMGYPALASISGILIGLIISFFLLSLRNKRGTPNWCCEWYSCYFLVAHVSKKEEQPKC